jgi:hypothetical protein
MLRQAALRQAALLVLSLAVAGLVLTVYTHRSQHRAELVGGYEDGTSNHYVSLPPVYGPVTVTQTVVPRTAVIVPICDKLGCYQMNACMDRWDFQTEYGGCEVTGPSGWCDICLLLAYSPSPSGSRRHSQRDVLACVPDSHSARPGIL